ncbi:MAG: putative Diguanylate cyclase [Comamonadaceae bacterium]|nr:MAG: putative Diguanylate cyclase [Comamonadaceae bacterium]
MHRYNLTRPFAILAFVFMAIAAVALVALVRQQQINQMERTTQERNVSLTRVIRKIYNTQGVTIFSTEPSQLGEDKSSNPGFVSALHGQVASELVFRNQFSAFDRMMENVDLVSSYIPVTHADRVSAVIEVYQDVTLLVKHIHDTLWQVWSIVLTVMVLLYLLLMLVVARSQKLLRENELLLEMSNNALDQRVRERTQALQQSENRFRCLSEMSSGFCWETDSDHRFTLRTLSKMETEHPLHQLEVFIGKLLRDMPCGSPGDGAWEKFLAALEAQSQFRDVEISHLDAQGRIRHLSLSGDPQLNTEGMFTGYLGVGSDITERKQVEADLRIAATAFESQEAMMVTDAKAVILRINQAFTQITGYSAEEVIGQTPHMLASGRHDANFYRNMWNSINRHGVWTGEIWDRRKNGEVYTHYDITEQKKSEEKIHELAFFDPLTNLPNRTLLHDRLKQAMAGCHRHGVLGALVFIDLDHFKTLNDTYGHDKGDLLLQQIAQRLISNVREGDTVARLGGDEFVVILKNLGETDDQAALLTKQICENILTDLSQTYHLDNLNYHSSASMGATLFDGLATSIDELLKQADLAMYKSKDAGRNTLHFFDPAMQRGLLERNALESDLRQALEQGQLELHYQPQMSISGGIFGAEALVRWHHPQRGMIPPMEFIGLAEETGLILPLGHWVLETACQQLARWATQPELAHLTLAVNVSAKQMQQSNFVEQVLGVLASTRPNTQHLKLELTESLLMDNLEDVICKMKALKLHGISFSLDDFGTGYSSLSYLSHLPLDQLKIDRSFVMHIETQDRAMAICAAIISMAHSLKLRVVAEGVETEAQRYILNTVHHCDYLQGYLFSQPLPIAEFETFVAQNLFASKTTTRPKNT